MSNYVEHSSSVILSNWLDLLIITSSGEYFYPGPVDEYSYPDCFVLCFHWITDVLGCLAMDTDWVCLSFFQAED